MTPANKSKALTQEEIWDDSALIRSWDEALEEYKQYHSLQARKENIEDILREASVGREELDRENGDPKPKDDGASKGPSAILDENGEDGELDGSNYNPQEEDLDLQPEPARAIFQATLDHPPFTAGENSAEKGVPPPQLRQARTTEIPGGELIVGDDDLKSLMMSWYYAGYYTGLYEGRQSSKQGVDKAGQLNPN